MRLQKQSKTSALIGFGLIFLFIGCTPYSTGYRQAGFNMMHKGFVSLNESPFEPEVVELKNVKVHIVSHRKHFNWNKAAEEGSGILGYANNKNEIWVFGRIINGMIVINQAVLGHELNHLLNFKYPKIVNPDKLDQLEYYDAHSKRF